MSNDKPIKLPKVIQFADSSVIRGINKGYYGDPSEWNPRGYIDLVPIEEVSTLEAQGIKFEQIPSLREYSTFVEVIPTIYACIERKRYAPTFMERKQKGIAKVLQKLGIHEYYISSSFIADAEASIGRNEKKNVNVKTTMSKFPFSGSIDKTKSLNNGVNFGAYYVKKEYQQFEGRMPSMKEWEEAYNMASDEGVYSDISHIIEMRKPGNNGFLLNRIELNIGGVIDDRISLASPLQALVGSSPLGEIGGSVLKSFDFRAKLEGHYETVIFYNFNPKVNSKEYQDFVNEQLQKKDS